MVGQARQIMTDDPEILKQAELLTVQISRRTGRPPIHPAELVAHVIYTTEAH